MSEIAVVDDPQHHYTSNPVVVTIENDDSDDDGDNDGDKVENKKKKRKLHHHHHHHQHHDRHRRSHQSSTAAAAAQSKPITNVGWMNPNVISQKQLKEFPALTTRPLEMEVAAADDEKTEDFETLFGSDSGGSSSGSIVDGNGKHHRRDFIPKTTKSFNADGWDPSSAGAKGDGDDDNDDENVMNLESIQKVFDQDRVQYQQQQKHNRAHGDAPPLPHHQSELDAFRQQKILELSRRMEIAQTMMAPMEDGAMPKLTEGQKKMLKMLQQPKTDEDVGYTLKFDGEGLHWVPIKHPNRSRVDELLGAELPREQCWGCAKGVGGPITPSRQKLLNLTNFYVENRTFLDDWEMALTIHALFENTIRQHANADIANPDLHIPEWEPRSIYDHFTTHLAKDPTHAVGEVIEMDRLVMRHIYDNMLFRVPREVYVDRSRPIAARDLMVHPESLKMFLQAQTALFKAFEKKPQTMYGWNPNFSIGDAGNASTTFAPKHQRGIVVDMANGTAGVSISANTSNSMYNPKNLMKNA